MYIGLLRCDGTEPPKEAGYQRILASVNSPQDILYCDQIVFPDVQYPGYGVITAVAVYASECDPTFTEAWLLPTTWDFHEGVIPVVHKGVLYRCMEVQAEISLCTGEVC